MGRAFALRIVKAELPLVVANRTHRTAAEFAAAHGVEAVELDEVFAAAEICVSSVADDAALEALVSRLLSGEVPPGRALVDMSTVSVDSSRRVAERLAGAGVGYLRAPVSGNPSVVEAGRLAVMVSGEPALLERARPVIEAIGPTVFSVGDTEQARAMKLALNLVIAGTTELIVEALALAEAGAIPRARALEVMTGSVIGSPFLQYKAAALRDRDYTATASTELIAKDVTLAEGLAGDCELALPLTNLVGELLAETVALGHGDKDFLALELRLEHSRRRDPVGGRSR
jgi:3-hydroxyisobutyrate dehydrogenase-like beta-hydroxyacid dehydrogenase